MLRATRTNRRRLNGHRGAAAAECAVGLPVVALLVLATIEACTMMYLKQSLTIAAYEAGRIAIMPGATSAEVVAECEQILADRNVLGAQISLNPPDITTALEGSHIQITVSAPSDDNLVAGQWFFGGKTLTGRSEFMKEY